MIGWLLSVDVAVFRFINLSWSNSFFDRLMPFLSGSPWFVIVILFVCLGLLIFGGARGRLCVLMLALALCFGNWIVCNSVKNVVARPRPFLTVPGAHLRIGMGGSYSMPSSHAANWFSAMLIFFIYYRRSIWAFLPMAVIVSLSRIYNGVHYPSDVLVGAALGMGYSAAIAWGLEMAWQSAGLRWFPRWHKQLPSLLNPSLRPLPAQDTAAPAREAQWLRLGYLATGALLLLRLAYLASGKIELTQDEAYQWLWSKHLDWSYYSKPPLIAVAQFIGTHLWGDNEFGVRFLSPVIAAILSILVLRFMAREAGGRVAFITLIIVSVTPLMALGATIMTVDPLSVLFWVCALMAGWRASGAQGTTRQWMWAGLWIGLGFLSKYTNYLQLISWLFFFALWPPARSHLRKPGPYLGLMVSLLCCLPVVIWNAQHGWITVHHVANDAHYGEKSHRTYVLDFFLSETAVLHPFFFVGMLWSAVAFWRTGRRDPLQLYLFSMGAPVFILYLCWSFHSRIQPNWIAPSVIPLFCLMTIYWARRLRDGARWVRPLLCAGIGVGVLAVVFLCAPNLLGKLLQHELPANLDLLHRAHGWPEVAAVIENARHRLEAEGQPVFIIGDDYGVTSEVTFYLPAAKARASSDPLVYQYITASPLNQFYFWPNYKGRAGQNAIFARDLDRPPLRRDWLARWWHHDGDIYTNDNPVFPVPPEVRAQFDSCTRLGVVPIISNGELVRRVQLFSCRHLHAYQP